MYAIPDAIKEGFAKIKVLELMLFLSVFDTQEAEWSPSKLTSVAGASGQIRRLISAGSYGGKVYIESGGQRVWCFLYMH